MDVTFWAMLGIVLQILFAMDHISAVANTAALEGSSAPIAAGILQICTANGNRAIAGNENTINIALETCPLCAMFSFVCAAFIVAVAALVALARARRSCQCTNIHTRHNTADFKHVGTCRGPPPHI
jgi:hypothetical protein